MNLKLFIKVIHKEKKWIMKFASRAGIVDPENLQASVETQFLELIGYDVLVAHNYWPVLVFIFSAGSFWLSYRVYIRFLARYQGRFYLLFNRRHLYRLAKKHLTPSGIQDALFSLLEG